MKVPGSGTAYSSKAWCAPLLDQLLNVPPSLSIPAEPNPLDVVQAFDAKTGDLKWEYRRRLPEDLNKFFPVPAINRNLAIYDNLIIDTSADDFVYALNANTGELVWETPVMEARKPLV